MTDRYTKAVLTIIAFSLVWICATDAARGETAYSGNRMKPLVLGDSIS